MDSSQLADRADLLRQMEELRLRLQEAEDTLQAIRAGEIDALLVEGEKGDQVFTLKGAEHGYRLFVESMHEGAVTLRSDGLILYCNTRFASLLDIPLSKTIGSNFKDFIVAHQIEEIEKFLCGQDDRRKEFELKSTWGAPLPVVLAISAALVEEFSGAMCMIVTDLREQRHLEQLQQTKVALEQSQNQLKIALETARLGPWELDLHTGRMECSPQCRANFGLSDEQPFTYQDLVKAIHPEDRLRVDKTVQRSLEQNSLYECEYRIYWPNGSIHWILASGRVMTNEAGVPVRMIGVSLNNTARKKVEESLREAQTRMDAILTSAEIGTWTWDLHTDQIVVDKNLAEILSATLDQGGGLPSETFLKYIHPEDRFLVRIKINESLKSRSGWYEADFRVVRPDGLERWLTSRGQVERDNEGYPLRLPGVVIDITSRKQIEEALKESENRFRTLAEAIPQLSWTCLPDGRCDYLSQQWLDYTGIPLEEQLGFEWMSVLHPDDRKTTYQAWQQAVETGGDYDIEFRLRASSGEYCWFKTRGIPVRGIDKKVVRWFGTCTEIEDIVQARQILNRDKEELEKLVALRTASLHETTEQLNSFCYTVAHDLRAPLRAQQGYARIILEDFGEVIGDTGKQFAQRIVNAAEKLEKLVQDLLSQVSLSQGDLPLTKVEISAVVSHVRDDLDDLIQKSAAQLEVGPLRGFVSGNEASLNLIVANLVSNALKFAKPQEPPQIKIWSESTESTVRLWVEDRGLGIKPEYHEKIFGVFQRLHSSDLYPGTGIGLALVLKGTERMGGRAGVISEYGVGSRFWIELPIFKEC